jgi:hypothetical protein
MMVGLRRHILIASVLALAIAATAAAQNSKRLSLTPDQCAAAPELDKGLEEINVCRDWNGSIFEASRVPALPAK